MNERKFLKWLLLRGLIISVIFAAASLLSMVLNHFELYEPVSSVHAVCTDGTVYEISPDEISFVCEPEGCIRISDAEIKDEQLYVCFTPLIRSSQSVAVSIVRNETGQDIDTVFLQLHKSGLVTDDETANFSQYRKIQLFWTIAILAYAFLLAAGYLKSEKELGYSYHSIFCSGLGLWVLAAGIVSGVYYLLKATMFEMYHAMADAPMIFALFNMPAVIFFGVLLCISNFILIRKEGFRFTNILGILLSFLMITGFLMITASEGIYTSGYEFTMKLAESFTGLLYSVYTILECFLIGAIICGIHAVRYQPAYDKDYIVILGCMIRKDGTLYPLLKGRADRALRFYREQFEKTGKKAVFIPSGGQGSDEPMAEAAAIRNYLLQCGIEEDQIVIEDQSVNTKENMRFSKQIAGEGKTVFATSGFHVFRSGIIAREAGFPAEGIGAASKWYFWPNAYIREVIGMLSYKWRSLMNILIMTGLFLTFVRMYF